MSEPKIITGSNEAEIWQQVSNDLAGKDVLEYNVVIDDGTCQVEIDIDIDLGGGFEGGFKSTTMKAVLNGDDDFRFAIHKEHFLDEVGKFFGMQDVVIGDPDFDKHVVVKTNDETRVKTVFNEENVRRFFETLSEDFTFGITSHNHERMLELSYDKGIVDAAELKTIYDKFCSVLRLVKAPSNGSIGS